MSERRREISFAGMFAVELLIVTAIFIVAIVLVRLNTITLKDLQEFLG